MEHHILIGVSAIVVFGVGAQWAAWRFHLPSILLLLVVGFVVGPVTGFIDPDHLLGDLLFPVVSISVAIVLFEGGLSLKMSELRGGVGGVVTNLITFGVLVTWVLGAAAAHFITGLDLELSLLLAAILVVSGPTVVVPLLLHVRPEPRIGAIAKWEGIMNDPIGAILAVLVFQELLSGGLRAGAITAVGELFTTLLIGGSIGAVGAVIMIQVLKRHWCPEHLHNPVMLMAVIADFALSNTLQEESGLLAVTIMGVLMANQSQVAVKHIVEFKETLRVLLISSLFILLTARIDVETFAAIRPSHIIFVLVMMFVVRPLAVAASTFRSNLDWRDKLFLVWMAPRGIVAAAVSSIFALRLAEAGFESADQLVVLTFLVITSTVAVYGLTAGPLARVLHLAEPERSGFLILGAHGWGRDIAVALANVEVPVLVVDTNAANIELAENLGLSAYHGNLLSEHALEEMNLGQIGKLLAMTPNDEVNTLSTFRVGEYFKLNDIYQLPFRDDASERTKSLATDLHGRLLFGSGHTYDEIDERYEGGARIEMVTVARPEDWDDLVDRHPDSITPLFAINDGPTVEPFTQEGSPDIRPRMRMIVLAEPGVLREETRDWAMVDQLSGDDDGEEPVEPHDEDAGGDAAATSPA